VLWQECDELFGIKDIDHRLFHGGLPEPLLSREKDAFFFFEWFDSFFARDIQELFGVRNRTGFIKLLHLILRQSGGLVDYTNLAKLSQLSRPTVQNHIEAMKIADAVFLLPPFHGGSKREITQRPKCYGFDTGFVTFAKGWNDIREEDRGLLWEHLVLDSLRVDLPQSNIYYWRDKSGREIDFVIVSSSSKVHTIECKINPDQFESKALRAFRSVYPEGKNLVICPKMKQFYSRRLDGMVIHFSSLTKSTFSQLLPMREPL